MSLASALFRLARLAADAGAAFSGSSSKMGRRAKNKGVGRLLGKAGIWRSLWR